MAEPNMPVGCCAVTGHNRFRRSECSIPMGRYTADLRSTDHDDATDSMTQETARLTTRSNMSAGVLSLWLNRPEQTGATALEDNAPLQPE